MKEHTFTTARHHNVLFVLFVFYHIRKVLNKLHIFGMSLIQLILSLQVFQELIIRMNDEFLGPKVVLPRL